MNEYEIQITITTKVYADTEDEAMDMASDLLEVAQDPSTEIADTDIMSWCEA